MSSIPCSMTVVIGRPCWVFIWFSISRCFSEMRVEIGFRLFCWHIFGLSFLLRSPEELKCILKYAIVSTAEYILSHLDKSCKFEICFFSVTQKRDIILLINIYKGILLWSLLVSGLLLS